MWLIRSRVAPLFGIAAVLVSAARVGNAQAPAANQARPPLPPQATEGPAGDVLEGIFEAHYEDYANGSRLRHELVVNERRIPVQFAGDPPDLPSGSVVRARGRMENNTLMLASGADVQAVSLATPNTFGEQRVVVLLVNFSDNTSQPYTRAAAQATTFQTVRDYFYESSYRQTWLTGDVFGWYTLPVSSATCDSNAIATEAERAATAAGVNLSAYTRKIYAFPDNACNWWGLGSVGGNPSRAWVNGSYALQVVAHELGHNFGDYHSHSVPCDANGCSVLDYGDDRDMMGNRATGHFTAFQKERLGWLGYGSSPPIQTVSETNTYYIEAYSTFGTAPKALKILKGLDASGRRIWYYIEARARTGFDAAVVPGVLVHTGTEGVANSSNQIDLAPSVSGFDSTLDPAQEWAEPGTGVRFSTAFADAAGAMINVTFDGAACTETAPGVSLSPGGTPWVAPGTSTLYTMTVTNRDSGGCSDALIDLGATVPSGWTAGFGQPSITLAPGGTASTSFVLTSAGSASGRYTFQGHANRAGSDGTVSGDIVVVSSLGVSLSVSRAGNGYQFSATVQGGGLPAVGAGVVFTVTDPNGGQRTLNATANASGVANAKHRVTRNDPPGTYQVRATATKSGFTGSATGSFLIR